MVDEARSSDHNRATECYRNISLKCNKVFRNLQKKARSSAAEEADEGGTTKAVLSDAEIMTCAAAISGARIINTLFDRIKGYWKYSRADFLDDYTIKLLISRESMLQQYGKLGANLNSIKLFHSCFKEQSELFGSIETGFASLREKSDDIAGSLLEARSMIAEAQALWNEIDPLVKTVTGAIPGYDIETPLAELLSKKAIVDRLSEPLGKKLRSLDKKLAFKRDISLKEACIKLRYLSAKEFDEKLNPAKMV